MPRSGLLLINLGTPAAPQAREVREYLREFLMDPFVVDLPFPLRFALVYGFILPKRPAQSAAAYRKVWTDRGSPLLVNHVALASRLAAGFPDWTIAPAMRYGHPSIAEAVGKLAATKVDEVLILPLYPQFSLAATESSLQLAGSELHRQLPGARVRKVRDFFDHPAFVGAFAFVIGETLGREKFDHLLFSFHGLPERQILKSGVSKNHCLASASCCDQISDSNRLCYRAQCFATARAVAGKLGLSRGFWSVSFQSRLGRTPWIKPFTDFQYGELVKSGVRRLAVACPSFVADCLETLEEVQIRGRDQFLAEGGEELRLVPSLNSTETWVQGLGTLVREAAARD